MPSSSYILQHDLRDGYSNAPTSYTPSDASLSLNKPGHLSERARFRSTWYSMWWVREGVPPTGDPRARRVGIVVAAPAVATMS